MSETYCIKDLDGDWWVSDDADYYFRRVMDLPGFVGELTESRRSAWSVARNFGVEGNDA
mgnify:CR=1 FL=1